MPSRGKTLREVQTVKIPVVSLITLCQLQMPIRVKCDCNGLTVVTVGRYHERRQDFFAKWCTLPVC